MKKKIHIFSIIIAFAMFTVLGAQSNEMLISGTKIIEAGETFNIEAGQIVVFEPGARIIVNGGLKINGTSKEPVIIKSRDSENPGMGIVVKAVNESDNVSIKHVVVSDMVQFLRFDPFWYRKSVKISEITVHDLNFNEPMIYASTPYLDLRESKEINFELASATFFNNKGNVILEKLGSAGIKYVLEDITFNDNNIEGENASMGVMHLDFARNTDVDNVRMGNFTFVNNRSGDYTVGLSLSGGPGTPIEIKTGSVYSNSPISQVVYDNRNDDNLPKLGIDKTTSLKERKGTDGFVTGARHEFGKITFDVVGDVQIKSVRDSFNRGVNINQLRNGDTLTASYLEGNPFHVTLQNGVKVRIPKLTAAQLPPPIYRKVDTTLISPEWPDTTMKAKIGFMVIVPMFGKKEDIVKLRTWEFGIWGGASIYGGGDIPHKFAPMPSTLEISYGGYAQFNFTNRFSIKTNIYHSTISMHNLWATGLLSGGKVPFVESKNFDKIQPYPNTWPLMFVTPMTIWDVEGVWHIGKYNLKPGQKWKLVNSMGISAGIFTYTPYRISYRNQKNSESFADYKARLWSEERTSLRELGMEGQNFLENKKPYGLVSGNVGLSWQLAYLRKRWALKGEMKAVYTFTDYLDDYGPGIWYGGDHERWLNTIKEDEYFTNPDNKFFIEQNGQYLPLAKFNKISGGSTTPDLISTTAARSTNGLNDWYFQLHMGLSYILSKPNAEVKEFTPLKQIEEQKSK
jgi:hypothetical protein